MQIIIDSLNLTIYRKVHYYLSNDDGGGGGGGDDDHVNHTIQRTLKY